MFSYFFLFSFLFYLFQNVISCFSITLSSPASALPIRFWIKFKKKKTITDSVTIDNEWKYHWPEFSTVVEDYCKPSADRAEYSRWDVVFLIGVHCGGKKTELNSLQTLVFSKRLMLVPADWLKQNCFPFLFLHNVAHFRKCRTKTDLFFMLRLISEESEPTGRQRGSLQSEEFYLTLLVCESISIWI